MRGSETTRGVDVIAVVLVVLLMIEAVALSAGARAYTSMFRDFGGELPFMTKLFLRPWISWVVALSLSAFALEGVMRKRSDASMVVRVIVALVGALALPVGFAIGIYLPILQLAST